LRPLLSGNPNALLLAPRAMRQQALERADVAEDRLILISAGEIIAPFSNLSIAATASAHEALETDTNGNHRFLGYAIDMPLADLWHSGDCIPYPGLEQAIVSQKPDIVLLPVNGRRPELSEHGVPGNFTLQEAIDLACAAGATDMIAHHYGLFDFNTEDPNVIDAAALSTQDIHIHRAQTGLTYMWQPE